MEMTRPSSFDHSWIEYFYRAMREHHKKEKAGMPGLF
jgi:hypothetical protein